jgi:hypothetical protein
VQIRAGDPLGAGDGRRNWLFAGVVDDGADPAQREALAAIVGGEADGPPGHIRRHLVGDFRGVVFKPIEFVIDGYRRKLAIPDIAAFEVEGVVSRNRSGEPFYLDNTGHPANRRLALARARATRVRGFGLDLDFVGKGNNGHFAPFAWAA